MDVASSEQTDSEQVTTEGNDPVKATNDRIEKLLVADIAKSKVARQDLLPTWQTNVELRMGRLPASADTAGVQGDGNTQSELNPDWSLTKTKTANLYSQVPTVQGTHENKQYATAVPSFMKSLNYELGPKRTNIGVAMEEVLNDVVNASGIGGMIVGFAARFQETQVPVEDTSLMDPNEVAALKAAGTLEMTTTFNITDSRMFVTRISPKDLLTPQGFKGSNFDDGPMIGYSGEKSWSEAQNEWHLQDSQKESCVNKQGDATEQLTVDTANSATALAEEMVAFDEIYYWRYRFDPKEPHFCAIWKYVKVQGIDKPVVHEPWKGQRYNEETGTYVGAKKFPIRILTLTYVTDNPIPPSDSEAGRPQVNDLRRSRSQMFLNRKNSLPLRWFDVNRVDPLVQLQMMDGTWQGMLPMNGDGTRAVGEVARATYPSEDLTFDRNTRSDLLETWQIGPNQLGAMSTGDHTKAETDTAQSNFATRIGQERGRVSAFFLSAVEVLAGWMALYSDFPILTPEERDAMEQAWDHKAILHDLVLKIRPDSTIVLDVGQQLDRLFKLMNMTVKSGYVNPKPLITLAFELSGFDPAESVVDPQPPKPQDPNISYRFTGKDDLMNPMVIGMLEKRGELPSIEDLQKAIDKLKMINQMASAALPAPAPQGASAVLPPTADAPAGPTPLDPSGEPAHPDWQLMQTVAKRQRDI